MNSGWASDFSYGYFGKILQIVKTNFELHLLSQAPQIVEKLGRSKLILRHDVDVSLKRAVRMARIEKDFGIRATYMVMTESSLYNIEDDTSRKLLQKVIDMKHEIGLHIDPSLHKETGSMESRLDSACKKLENIIGQVSSFSFHKPPTKDLERCKHDLIIGDRVNAYAEVLTGRSWERYLADSSGCWKYGEPLPWLKEPNISLRQLLTHPIWWGEENMSREKRLRDFVMEEARGRSLEFTKKLRNNIIETIQVDFNLHGTCEQST